jgi:hypothetical protein
VARFSSVVTIWSWSQREPRKGEQPQGNLNMSMSGSNKMMVLNIAGLVMAISVGLSGFAQGQSVAMFDTSQVCHF